MIKIKPNQVQQTATVRNSQTFSDKLWTSAALDLLDELLEGAGFVGTSSAKASTPSCVQKLRSNCKEAVQFPLKN